MCTGRIAFVRLVTAASAACGSRFNVTGSMSANTGLAPSYTIALAEATNDSGLVTTSSPASTPTARNARCNPAVPLLTAQAYGAPTRAANMRSNSASFGPSESCPERSTSSTARSSASPSTGLARGIKLRNLGHGDRLPPSIPRSSESTNASQDAAIRFSETPIDPHTSCPSEASINTRVTAPVPLVSSRIRTLKLTRSMSFR